MWTGQWRWHSVSSGCNKDTSSSGVKTSMWTSTNAARIYRSWVSSQRYAATGRTRIQHWLWLSHRRFTPASQSKWIGVLLRTLILHLTQLHRHWSLLIAALKTTKLVSEYMIDNFFRIVSGGRSSQEDGRASGGSFLLLFSVRFLIYKYIPVFYSLTAL